VTRLAILSDIHSNLPALEAVLDDLKAFRIDRMVVAGDVVNWGPFSRQVMERLADERCAIIRGNNELYLTDWNTPRMPAGWEHFTLPPYTIGQLGDEWMGVIASWPDTLTLRFREAATVRVVHGNPASAFIGMMPSSSDAELAAMLEGVEANTVIGGHSHLSIDRQVGRWHVVNPGTVGNPIDGDLRASYMLMEGDEQGWRATRRQVTYDVQRVLDEFERTDFVEQCGVVGHLIVEEHRTGRLKVLPFLKWWRTHFPDEAHRMDLLEPFAQANLRDYTPLDYQNGMD